MKDCRRKLRYKEATLSYSVYGNGPKKVIAFHGFGQDSAVFEDYAKLLGEAYCLYSFDLFFHGDSVWPYGDQPLEKEAWQNMFQAFRTQEAIENFALIGFSIGAKVLLATLVNFPQAITSITLIAPDGIKTNGWYKLATEVPVFRKCFKYLIEKPVLFFNSLELLNKLGFLDKSLTRFVKSQMKTKLLREKVYHTWMVYRKLSFKKGSIAFIINKYNIPISIFLGESDKVIKPSQLKQFLTRLDNYDLKVIPGSHPHVLERFLRESQGQ